MPSLASSKSPDAIRQAIAQAIREGRVRAGLSISEAARSIGVSRRTINRWESAQDALPAHHYLRASRLYGIDPAIGGDAPAADLRSDGISGSAAGVTPVPSTGPIHKARAIKRDPPKARPARAAAK